MYFFCRRSRTTQTDGATPGHSSAQQIVEGNPRNGGIRSQESTDETSFNRKTRPASGFDREFLRDENELL